MSEIVSLSLSSILRSVVDCALPTVHPTRALYVGLDLRLHDEEYQPLKSCSVHLLFRKRSNYLTVWGKSTPREILPRWSKVKPEDWGKHLVHHDSCWLGAAKDEIINAFFDMCKEADSDKAPAAFNQFHTISSTALLDVETERVKRDGWGEDRFVTSISEFKPQGMIMGRDGNPQPVNW